MTSCARSMMTDSVTSVVRKQCGFAFEGTSPEQRGVIGEMYIEGLDTEVSLVLPPHLKSLFNL